MHRRAEMLYPYDQSDYVGHQPPSTSVLRGGPSLSSSMRPTYDAMDSDPIPAKKPFAGRLSYVSRPMNDEPIPDRIRLIEPITPPPSFGRNNGPDHMEEEALRPNRIRLLKNPPISDYGPSADIQQIPRRGLDMRPSIQDIGGSFGRAENNDKANTPVIATYKPDRSGYAVPVHGSPVAVPSRPAEFHAAADADAPVRRLMAKEPYPPPVPADRNYERIAGPGRLAEPVPEMLPPRRYFPDAERESETLPVRHRQIPADDVYVRGTTRYPDPREEFADFPHPPKLRKTADGSAAFSLERTDNPMFEGSLLSSSFRPREFSDRHRMPPNFEPMDVDQSQRSYANQRREYYEDSYRKPANLESYGREFNSVSTASIEPAVPQRNPNSSRTVESIQSLLSKVELFRQRSLANKHDNNNRIPPLRQPYELDRQPYEPARQHFEPVREHFEPVREHFEPVRQQFEPIRQQHAAISSAGMRQPSRELVKTNYPFQPPPELTGANRVKPAPTFVRESADDGFPANDSVPPQAPKCCFIDGDLPVCDLSQIALKENSTQTVFNQHLIKRCLPKRQPNEALKADPEKCYKNHHKVFDQVKSLLQFDKCYENAVWDYDPKFEVDYLPNTKRGADERMVFVYNESYMEEENKWRKYTNVLETINRKKVNERMKKVQSMNPDSSAPKAVALPTKDLKIEARDPAETKGVKLAGLFEAKFEFPEELVTEDYCGLCDDAFVNIMASMSHYNSIRHSNAVFEYFCNEAMEIAQLLPADKQHWFDNAVRSIVKKYKTKPLEWRCDLCEIVLTGEAHALSHFSGVAHKRKAVSGLPTVQQAVDAEVKERLSVPASVYESTKLRTLPKSSKAAADFTYVGPSSRNRSTFYANFLP